MRQTCVGLLHFAILIALCSSVAAQHVPKLPRIGFLSTQSESRSADRAEAFRQGLRDLGYSVGKNILIEYRWADGINHRLPELAADLVRLKVNAIVTSGGTQAITAAKNATSSIPIVISGGGDVVAAGLVESFPHPGGNVTGVTIGGPELYGKRLEILKEVIPKLLRVAHLFNPTGSGSAVASKEIRRSAQDLALQVQLVEVRRAEEIAGAFDAAIKGRADALIVAQNPPISSDYKRIVDLTVQHRLPTIYADNSWPTVGGLMSYGSSISDQHRRMAKYVDKILKGANPADLPIEQPTKYEFVINLKTAKQIGLIIPPNVLARADRVIR